MSDCDTLVSKRKRTESITIPVSVYYKINFQQAAYFALAVSY